MDQVTKNFKLSEFACRCGRCENKISIDFIQRLQTLRNDYGKPMTITSGYRCVWHNRKVGGARGSKHMQGIAADIAIRSGNDRYLLVMLAMSNGFGGIGINSKFIHLDDRDSRPVLFTYG